MIERTYLGSGVYATFDTDRSSLTLETGARGIALNATEIVRLTEFLDGPRSAAALRELLRNPCPAARPPDFPAYARYTPRQGERPFDIVCNYRGCGHLGFNGRPCYMECGGRDCPCPCCQMLAGAKVYGSTYG